MTHFLGFDGRHKRSLQQNLSGQHTESVSDILKRSQQERQKRENERLRNEAAIKVQSFIRGSLARQAQKALDFFQQRYSRQQFDKLFEEFRLDTVAKSTLVNSNTSADGVGTEEQSRFRFLMLLRCINNFYLAERNDNADIERLVKMSRLFIENAVGKRCFNESVQHFALDHVYIVGRFIWKVSGTLYQLCRVDANIEKTTVSVLLRTLEVTVLRLLDPIQASDVSSRNALLQLILYLLNKGFVGHLMQVLQRQEMSGGVLSFTTEADIPAYVNRPWAKAVLSLIMSPLQFIQSTSVTTSSYGRTCSSTADSHQQVVKQYLYDVFVSASNQNVAFLCCKHVMAQSPILLKHLPAFHEVSLQLKTDESRLHLAHFIVYEMHMSIFTPPNKADRIFNNGSASAAPFPLIVSYVTLLAHMLQELTAQSSSSIFHLQAQKLKGPVMNDEEDYDEEDPMEMDDDQAETQLDVLKNSILEAIWKRFGPLLCKYLSDNSPEPCTEERVTLVSRILYSLLIVHKQPVEDILRLVSGLSRGNIIALLWQHLSSLLQAGSPPASRDLVVVSLTPKLLSTAMRHGLSHGDDVLYLLVTWSFLYYYNLLTLEEASFELTCQENADSMQRMVIYLRTALVSIIEIVHSPGLLVFEKDKNVTEQMQFVLLHQWVRVFNVLKGLFIQLYHRSRRKQLIDKMCWLLPRQFTVLFKQFKWHKQLLLSHDFGYLSPANPHRHVNFLKINKDDAFIRSVLLEIPYSLPFEDRLSFLQSLLKKDRGELQSHVNLPVREDIIITVRRRELFEDAFSELLPQNVPDFRRRLRVEFTNEAGLTEAGVDGGGLTREFLTEVIRRTYDPKSGLFVMSENERRLYPNTTPDVLFPDGLSQQYYFFAGRILAKVIYESHLVELPLADFFLAKILAHSNCVRDLGYLNDLDPSFCSNLLSLNWQDVTPLALDFTTAIDNLGKSQIIELKPNGQNIPVTEENKLEYIYLMIDFKLNKQFQSQIKAFKEGLCDLIDLSWLQLFDPSELQVVISGSDLPIDLSDWQSNCVISANSTSSQAVTDFWTVVETFNDAQRRQLLRFVTSCSRPPMFGFHELHPPFTIQVVPLTTSSAPTTQESQRLPLPTVSTCMNLLKLPDYGNINLLREKLLYAISANAGFELS